MHLNTSGKIVEYCILQISTIYKNVYVDECIIMPDHVHMILHISTIQNGNNRDVSMKRLYQGNHKHMSQISPSSKSLSVIIRSFKGESTNILHKINPEFSWQSNYHDRIIRSEYELEVIQNYVRLNPAKDSC